MKLREISEGLLDIVRKYEADRIDELPLVYGDFMEELGKWDEAFEQKADSFANLLTDIDSDIDLIKAEEDRLKHRRKALENKKVWLKSLLHRYMVYTGKKKFKTPLYSFSTRSFESIEVLDISRVPAYYLRTKETVEVDKEKVRKDIQDTGAFPPGVELKQTETVIIR